MNKLIDAKELTAESARDMVYRPRAELETTEYIIQCISWSVMEGKKEFTTTGLEIDYKDDERKDDTYERIECMCKLLNEKNYSTEIITTVHPELDTLVIYDVKVLWT